MTTSLTDQLGAKLREELIRPKGQDEHDGVLRDATAFNMAVSAKDDYTIRNLARKYGVKTPPKTSDEPKPKNGSGDMPVDSDEIAGKVLEGLKPYLATDKDGKPVKAASQADLEALSARVDKVDANFAYLGFTDKREDDGRPIFTENSWATYVTNRNTTDSGDYSPLIVVLCIVVGGFLGWLLGHLFLMLNWGFFGPDGGIFFGALAGAIASIWLAKKS